MRRNISVPTGAHNGARGLYDRICLYDIIIERADADAMYFVLQIIDGSDKNGSGNVLGSRWFSLRECGKTRHLDIVAQIPPTAKEVAIVCQCAPDKPMPTIHFGVSFIEKKSDAWACAIC